MIKMLIYILIVIISLSNSLPSHYELMESIKHKSSKEQFKVWHYAVKPGYELNSNEADNKFIIFENNLKRIREHNSKESSYKLTLTKFADYTQEEFKEKYLDFVVPTAVDGIKKIYASDLQTLYNKDSHKDLSKYDYTNFWPAIKDQTKKCGSCYAFGIIGVIEYFAFKKTGVLKNLSEQELVDCSTNSGCKGGNYIKSLEYTMSNGISLEEEYPYKAEQQRCKLNPVKPYIHTKGIESCDHTYGKICNENKIEELLKRGPYATAIDASRDFNLLGEGIYDALCFDINHAVIVTKIDTESVWVRNSWGNTFGVNGIGRIRRGVPQSIANDQKQFHFPSCGSEVEAYQPYGTIIKKK